MEGIDIFFLESGGFAIALFYYIVCLLFFLFGLIHTSLGDWLVGELCGIVLSSFLASFLPLLGSWFVFRQLPNSLFTTWHADADPPPYLLLFENRVSARRADCVTRRWIHSIKLWWDENAVESQTWLSTLTTTPAPRVSAGAGSTAYLSVYLSECLEFLLSFSPLSRPVSHTL